MRERLERDMRDVKICLLPERRRRRPVIVMCRTDGCVGVPRTQRGMFAGLCDECIAARGCHLAIS
jgi:hypothetical protein